MLQELVMLTVLICFIVDLSGFIDTVKKVLFRAQFGKEVSYDDNFQIKPLDCSLCATWWVCLFYIVICGQFSIQWIFACALLSFFSGVISEVLLLIREFLSTLIDKVHNKI